MPVATEHKRAHRLPSPKQEEEQSEKTRRQGAWVQA